jgi:hypothetical protein
MRREHLRERTERTGPDLLADSVFSSYSEIGSHWIAKSLAEGSGNLKERLRGSGRNDDGEVGFGNAVGDREKDIEGLEGVEK